MTSGSLTWATELDEGPDGSNMALFPVENADMTVYRGRSPSRGRRKSSLGPRILAGCGWGRGGSGV
jgi:hypothetical protein